MYALLLFLLVVDGSPHASRRIPHNILNKAKEAMRMYYKKTQAGKMENYQVEQGSYGYYGGEREEEKAEKPAREDRHVITGVPDISDICHRRYANVIVVNAQPYERRSRTPLAQCKEHCTASHNGVYSCHAFVYDYVNQVCDLFAHTGDQAPARLLKFHSRDYYEPTFDPACIPPEEGFTIPLPVEESTTTSSTPPPESSATFPSSSSSISSPPPVIARASNTHPLGEKIEKTEKTIGKEKPDSCDTGKVSRFMRTRGFELYGHDEVEAVLSEEECLSACEKNQLDETVLNCRSFDIRGRNCILSTESAVPIGNGQLKQNKDALYYEKLCIEQKLAGHCEKIFERFPQMILVGFAETVVDAASFEKCFENCLNSFHLYGFNCTSGMYYFEEEQLNCILNTENRHSQLDLFSEENTDIVDYFEVSCNAPSEIRRKEAKKNNLSRIPENPVDERMGNLVLAGQTETNWSPCQGGLQHRRVDCAKGMNGKCGLQSRKCASVLADCPRDKCCAVFGGCQVGLRIDNETKKLEWCRDPC